MTTTNDMSVEQLKARREEFKKTLGTLDKDLKKRLGTDDTQIALIPDMGRDQKVQRFSSGSLVLDQISGGGFPKGRVIEIYGPEASGKTSVALTAIGNIQREGGNAVFIDAEQALDINYAQTLGVDLSELALAQESVTENVIDLAFQLANSGNTDLIVIDSVASLVPQAELEGGMDKQQVGLQARLMSKGLRMITPACAKTGCTIIFINQIREKVGVMFGNPETTPGGRALKFAASLRIEVRRKAIEKENGEEIGTTVRMKIVKNKVAPPFKEGLTVLTFAHGINRPAEMLVVSEELGVFEKVGNTFWYTPKEDVTFESLEPDKDGRIKVGGSQKAAIATIEDNPDFYDVIAGELSEAFAKQRGSDPELEGDIEGKGKKKKK